MDGDAREPELTHLSFVARDAVVSRETVMSFMAASPFYDQTCNNELLWMQRRPQDGLRPPRPAELQDMTGLEYELDDSLSEPPFLWVIKKQMRSSRTQVQVRAVFYVIGSTIYQSPDVYALFKARMDTALLHLDTALDHLEELQRQNWEEQVADMQRESSGGADGHTAEDVSGVQHMEVVAGDEGGGEEGAGNDGVVGDPLRGKDVQGRGSDEGSDAVKAAGGGGDGNGGDDNNDDNNDDDDDDDDSWYEPEPDDTSELVGPRTDGDEDATAAAATADGGGDGDAPSAGSEVRLPPMQVALAIHALFSDLGIQHQAPLPEQPRQGPNVALTDMGAQMDLAPPTAAPLPDVAMDPMVVTATSNEATGPSQ